MAKPSDVRVGLSANELREKLEYRPDDGTFHWRPRSHAYKHGLRRAGSFDRLGYVRVRLVVGDRLRPFMAHRLAWFYMTGKWPAHEIDHINGNRADNRWANLREATHQQNSYNQRTRSKFQCTGVLWNKERRQWTANISANRKRIHLGYFDRFEDAVTVRLAASQQYHGDFASDRLLKAAGR